MRYCVLLPVLCLHANCGVAAPLQTGSESLLRCCLRSSFLAFELAANGRIVSMWQMLTGVVGLQLLLMLFVLLSSVVCIRRSSGNGDTSRHSAESVISCSGKLDRRSGKVSAKSKKNFAVPSSLRISHQDGSPSAKLVFKTTPSGANDAKNAMQTSDQQQRPVNTPKTQTAPWDLQRSPKKVETQPFPWDLQPRSTQPTSGESQRNVPPQKKSAAAKMKADLNLAAPNNPPSQDTCNAKMKADLNLQLQSLRVIKPRRAKASRERVGEIQKSLKQKKGARAKGSRERVDDTQESQKQKKGSRTKANREGVDSTQESQKQKKGARAKGSREGVDKTEESQRLKKGRRPKTSREPVESTQDSHQPKESASSDTKNSNVDEHQESLDDNTMDGVKSIVKDEVPSDVDKEAAK